MFQVGFFYVAFSSLGQRWPRFNSAARAKLHFLRDKMRFVR
jgi:hypothetical protein